MSEISPKALAKIQTIVFAFIGLLAGILYSFGGAIYDGLNNQLSWGTALAFLALIGMPLLFALAGFIFGLIEALLYNFVLFLSKRIRLK